MPTINQPDNTSYLSPLGFRFVLNRTPNTNYFVQNVRLPTLTLGQFDLEDPFVKLPTPGTKLSFEPLDITFLVDEDMSNYLEIHAWLRGLGFPETFDQYGNFIRNNQTRSALTEASAVFSDGTLMVLSNHQNGNIKVIFEDMFPIALSDLSFDSTLTDVEYLRATVTFRYKLYTIEKL
jgi:hypothetical protein|tara:strand:+ start:23 stop:556 length:534 start_codon:yes stop_codon:yes gene_type:complete